jgi:hypothetical protein
MFPLYPYPANDEFSTFERAGTRNRPPNRMDVERSRLEHQRMSYVATGPELHLRYIVENQQKSLERAARLHEARGIRESDGALTRLRSAIGNLLIDLGVHIRPTPPAPRGRVIIPRPPRTSKGVS